MIQERADALMEDIPEEDMEDAVGDDDGDSLTHTTDEETSSESSQQSELGADEECDDMWKPRETDQEQAMSVADLYMSPMNKTMGAEQDVHTDAESDEWGSSDSTYK
jgi:hypothetical protein